MKKVLSTITSLVVVSLAFTSTVSAQGYDYYYSDSLAADSVLAGFSFVWLCACCVGFLILAGIAYFMYSDAKKNNVENPVLWGILGFTGLIGLLIYFLVIRPEAIKKNSGAQVVESKSEETK